MAGAQPEFFPVILAIASTGVNGVASPGAWILGDAVGDEQLIVTVESAKLAMNATALGLWVSTLVSSAEAAMALTPIALIPQMVLGGLIVPMTSNPNLRCG